MSEEISKVCRQFIENDAVCPSCFSPYTFKMENLDMKIARRIPGCNHYMCEQCIIADGINTGQVRCRLSQCSTRMLWNDDIHTFPVATVVVNHHVATMASNDHVATVAVNDHVATMANNHNVATVTNNHNVATVTNNHNVATMANNHNVETVASNDHVATMVNYHNVATTGAVATNHLVSTNNPMATVSTNHPQTDGDLHGLLCGECDVKEANCFCQSCDVNLCSQCFDTIHSHSKSLRRHKATPLEIGKLSLENCGNDVEIVNRVTEDSQIGLYNEKCRNYLEDKVVLGRATLLRLIGLQSKLKSESIEGIGKSSEALKEAIQSHFSACQSELQSYQREIYHQLETQNKKTVSSLLNMVEYTATRIKHIEDVISIAEDALLDSSQSTPDSFSQILERLSYLDNEPCVLVKKGRTVSDIFQVNFPFVDLLEKHITMNYAKDLEVQVLPLNQVPSDYEDPVSLVHEAAYLNLNKDIHPLVNNVSQDTIEQKANRNVKYNASNDHQNLLEQKFNHNGDDHHMKPIVNHNVNDDRQDNMKPIVNHNVVNNQCIRGNNRSSVIISHIVNPGKFFIQRIADFNQVNQINESLKESSTSLKVEDVGRGDLVIARYSPTGEMYRANVISISEVNQTCQYNVQLIDYGIFATVELCDLRKVTPRQSRTPPLATECSLSGISPRELSNNWSQECVEAFKDLTLNKTLEMFEMKRLGVVSEVDLCIRFPAESLGDLTSVNDILIYRKFARFTSHPACRFPKQECQDFPTLNLLEKGKSFKVMVSDIVDPGEFSVQVVAVGEDRSWGRCIEKLFEDLQESYNTVKGHCMWPVYDPKVGTVCVAKYSRDGFYYRAKVVRLLEARVVEVNFVDFGNNEITDWSKLRALTQTDKRAFLEIPKLSFKVSLADTEPLKGSYSQESIEAFSQMTSAKEMLMYVEEDGVPTEVALYETLVDKDVCVNAWMVQRKLSKSSNGLYRVEYLKETSYQEIKDNGQSEPKMKSLSERAREVKNQTERRSCAFVEKRFNDSKDTVKYDANSDIKNDELVETKKPLYQSHETKCVSAARSKDKRKGGFYQVMKVVSPAKILVCNVNDIKRISRLNSDLSLSLLQHRSESSSLSVGSYCAAKLDFKTWARAKIISLNESNIATVFFYDTGNTQEVPVKELQDLPENFNEVKPYAKQVYLSDVRPTTGDDEWSDEVCEKLKELLFVEDIVTVLYDGKVVVEPSREMTSHPVQILIWESIEKGPLEPLEWKESSISEKLMNLKLAFPAKNPGPGKEAFLGQENLGSHIVKSTDGSFVDVSVERNDNDDKKIEPNCKHLGESLHSVADISPSCSLLEESLPSVADIAPTCRLLGESLPSVADISSLASLDTESRFQGIINKSTAPAISDTENEFIAEIEKEIFPFPKLFIPYTVGEEFPVTFLGQLSHDLIYCHLVPDQNSPCLHQNAREFRKMTEDLQAVGEQQPVVAEPRAGLAVIARYTVDRKWYRAVVTCELPLTVLFVDFGNTEQLEEVRSLPDGLKMTPVQAILFKFVSASSTDQQELISPEGLLGCRLVQLGATTEAEKPTATVELMSWPKPTGTVELMSWPPQDESEDGGGIKKATVVKMFQRQKNAQ